MSKEKIQFETQFNFHQKSLLLGFALISLYTSYTSFQQNPESYRYLVSGLLIVLGVFFILLFLSKKGLMQKGDKLYKTVCFQNWVLLRRRIDFSDRPVVSILRFRKSQKFSFIPAPNPEQTMNFNAFEIFVLNERHTKRDSVIYFQSQDNADKAMAFITERFPLRHEEFSPNLG